MPLTRFAVAKTDSPNFYKPSTRLMVVKPELPNIYCRTILPTKGRDRTSGYRFEYDLHLIKIPSHLDRESIYIKDEKHPEVLEKCELVGKGPSIPRYMQEMHLYFTGGMFYVNVRLAIELSLAKLAKRIYDLRHRLAIITL